MLSPPLTTVRIAQREIGNQAARCCSTPSPPRRAIEA